MDNVSESQLNELRHKFSSLEAERKSHYEQSMRLMKENKETIAILRGRNKDLAGKSKSMRKTQSQQVIHNQDEDTTGIDRQVGQLRKNHDIVVDKVAERKKQLQKLRDDAKAMEMEMGNRSAVDNIEKTSPENAKIIRTLENRLDRAMIKFNEAQNIHVTYDGISKRLREESTSFDSDLKAKESTVTAKEKEIEDLLSVLNDAHVAKEAAVKQLQIVRDDVERERKDRKRLLRRRQEMAQTLLPVWNEESESDEEVVEASISSFSIAMNFKPTKDKCESSLDTLEAAFLKIQKEMGTGSLDEVVLKMQTQTETKEQLGIIKVENEMKLSSTNQEYKTLRTQIEELTFSGASHGNSRNKLDSLQDNLSDKEVESQRSREKFEFKMELLIYLQAGIEHLSILADPFFRIHDPNHIRKIGFNDLTPEIVATERVLVFAINTMDSEVDLDMLQTSPSKDLTPRSLAELRTEAYRTLRGKRKEAILRNLVGDYIEEKDHYDQMDSDEEYGNTDFPISRSSIKSASTLLTNKHTGPKKCDSVNSSKRK